MINESNVSFGLEKVKGSVVCRAEFAGYKTFIPVTLNVDYIEKTEKVDFLDKEQKPTGKSKDVIVYRFKDVKKLQSKIVNFLKPKTKKYFVDIKSAKKIGV